MIYELCIYNLSQEFIISEISYNYEHELGHEKTSKNIFLVIFIVFFYCFLWLVPFIYFQSVLCRLLLL
jgi:beta-lactamase regulating signal transducer with metallopeptidase domain